MGSRPLLVAVLALSLVLPALGAAGQATTSEEFARRQYESGLAFLRDGKFGEALKDFQAVVDNYPSSRVADAALLQIAMYQLDTAADLAAAQAALDILLKKYATSESAPMAHVLAGRLLVTRSRAQADIDAALSSFERVPRLYPDSEAVPASYYQAGETLRLTHRDEEAIARYRQVSIDFPRSIWAARAMIGEARCLVITGRALPAMELLQRVRTRFQGTPEASTALAWNTILYRLYLRPPAQAPYQFTGKALVGSAGKLKDIEAVGVDPKGTVIAAGGSAVVPFDAAGKMLGASSANKPVAITFDRAGRPLFVLESGLLRDRQAFGLSVPKPDGTPRVLEDVTAGVFTPFGDVLVADAQTKAINRFTTMGKHVGPFAAVNARRLAIDGTGRIAALDRDDGTVVLLDLDGKVRSKIPARGPGYQLERVVDIAFDAFGHLYALDRDQAAVFVFGMQAQPKLVTTVGLTGKAAGAKRPGAFGLDAAGRLFVYDDDSERLQIWQ